LLFSILTSLNLPAALDDVTNAQTLPESLRQKSAKVKADGGLQELERMINELPILQKRNKEILDEVGHKIRVKKERIFFVQTSRVLAEERSSDDALRAQFKEKWTRMASEKLTDPLWAELGKYKGIVETAANADAVVRQKFAKCREAIELLSRPEVGVLIRLESFNIQQILSRT
jgi:programmed cell death 6-interacting protein